MGTREDLLAAAKQCLAERGYARTTVRDIVAASNSNLAAINYHFGTRDKLLNQAMLESSTAAIQRILDSLPDNSAGAPAARLQSFLEQLIASFTNDPALWTANAEALGQALHSPALRAELGAAQGDARTGLGQEFAPGQPDSKVGALLQTLIGGLLIQWLVDPENAPTASDITAGLKALNALT
ncbi:TetR/AcrR family transcriptional regulator [Nocardia sp.]|uniref:TetR/AcrR family transcriptional regulator n=1 Tax=Nocardia sp. TaxID=1821 RepID=UPI00263345B5|nr:TetR/AcrR family transcriptional regulator [Nocardia sp.]